MEDLMGARSNGYSKVMRSDEPRWVIDFRYRDTNGRMQRYRRDASVQTAAAASSPWRKEYTAMPPACLIVRSLSCRETSPKTVMR